MRQKGIMKGKDLEDTRELTGREGTDKWASRPVGGAGRPHMSSSRGGFSCGGF
jgi:hypothetical protein